jgi:hypothetical protein
MESREGEARAVEHPVLRRFLHDVSAPLSAVALHLEAASRRAARGEDPAGPLATARKELARAFELFEKGRAEMLGDGGK